MHGLNLESWIHKMMFWENSADALAIYSLSYMLGIHTTVKYGETLSADDTPAPIKPKPKPLAAKPNRSGPTPNRISSRNKSTVALTVRLPPIKAEPADVPDKDKTSPVDDSVDPSDSQEDDIPLAEIAK